jgi:PPOX class probable F420-dependent enzyme
MIHHNLKTQQHRRGERSLNAEEERYLQSKDRGFLSTVNSDRTPTVVPVCFTYHEGKIYTGVDAKPKSKHLARVRNIGKGPTVAFIVDTYSKEWKRLSYLLIHGKGEVVTQRSERKNALKLLLEKYPQYDWLGTDVTEVLKITIERTKFWRFKD